MTSDLLLERILVFLDAELAWKEGGHQSDTPAPNGLKSIAQNLKDGFSQVSGCSLLAPRLLNHFRNNRGNLQEE